MKIDAEFAAAERAPDSPAATKPSSLATAIAHVRQHIESLDERSAARLATDPPESEGQKSEMIADVELALQILKSRDDPRANDWIDSTSSKILTADGGDLSDKDIVTSFAEIVGRGLIQLQIRKRDRLEDRQDVRYHDLFFDPNPQSAVTFGQLVNIFWEEQLVHYQTNGISVKRADKTKTELGFLREAIGKDRPVCQITDDVVQSFRKTLARTPSNRKKLYPSLTLDRRCCKSRLEDATAPFPFWVMQRVRFRRCRAR